MKTIESVKIHNYRGLTEAEVSGLGRVNLVVGRNGSGKTSLLEALALACLGNKPEQLLLVSLSRGGILSKSSLQSIFGKKGEEATIRLNTTAGEYGLTIHPPDAKSTFIPPDAMGTDAIKPLLTIKLTNSHPAKGGKTTRHEYFLEMKREGMTVMNNANCGECIQAFFLPCRIANHSAVRTLVSRLTSTSQESQLVDVLQVCDERVSDVRLLDDDIQIELTPKIRLPLASLGDGANRLALMAEGLLNDQASVLLIDEIDSGLHHTVMERFWEHVLVLMEKRPFQLFCTTHDEEMLEATLKPFEKFGKKDWLRKVAMTRHPNNNLTITVTRYEEMRYQIENEYPTRT